MSRPGSAYAGVGSFAHPSRDRARLFRLLFGYVEALLGIGQPLPEETKTVEASWGWIPALSLCTSASLIVIALALNAEGVGRTWGAGLFCGGLILLFFPIAARMAWPFASRFEMIALLLLATLSLSVIKMLDSPLAFSNFDEFLHWVTAQNILAEGKLFTPNSLLPISPLYPALEIVTTAVANITGMPIFSSAILLLGITRALFTCGLFLLFEKITGSSRLAAFACLIYMGNASAPVFHTSFAYESLAILFVVLALLATISAQLDTKKREKYLAFLAVPFLAALATTHHLAAYLTALFFLFLTGLVTLNGRDRSASAYQGSMIILTIITGLGSWLWSILMGASVSEYLGPNFEDGLTGLARMAKALVPQRMPFVSVDGSASPLWQRTVVMLDVAFISIGLATGFFRAFALAGIKFSRGKMWFTVQCKNNWLVLLTLLTLLFPITILFRLIPSAWELGNRLGPFTFFGVGPVVAISLGGLWLRRSTSLPRIIAVAGACTIVLLGSILTAWESPIDFPRRYKVGADASSIELMGIEAAKWTRQWLGTGNRFVADRINRLLLTAYGRQEVVTNIQDRIDTSALLFADKLGPEELNALKASDTDYLLVDMRMTWALPRLGIYFEGGEDPEIHEAPPDPNALLKFNELKGVSRPFDNGYIIIYDVRDRVTALRNGQ